MDMCVFCTFFLILGGLGPCRRHLGRRYQKRSQSPIGSSPFWEAILDHVCSKIGFVGILLVSILMFIFGMAFGRRLAPIWKDFDVILGSILSSFSQLFADAAKLQKCNPSQAKRLVLRGPGFHFCIIFANFLELFFVLLSG